MWPLAASVRVAPGGAGHARGVAKSLCGKGFRQLIPAVYAPSADPFGRCSQTASQLLCRKGLASPAAGPPNRTAVIRHLTLPPPVHAPPAAGPPNRTAVIRHS